MTTYALTTSWTQVAAANDSVAVQIIAGSQVVLTTGNTAPAVNSDGILLGGTGFHSIKPLANLWASAPEGSATLEVVEGFAATIS